METAFFPHTLNIIQNTSGRVTGVLSKPDNAPSENSTFVHINASPTILFNKIEYDWLDLTKSNPK